MLVFSKEEADKLSKIVGQDTDYVLDAYVCAVKDGGSLVEFHGMIDADEEKLVINLLAGNAVIEQMGDNEYTIIEKNTKQSSIETNNNGIKASVSYNGTDLDLHSNSIILDGDVQYIKQEKIEKETTVVVYTNNAQTLVFHGVNNFQVTSTGFGFDYTGKATGVTRHAIFNNSSTAGYAIAEETLWKSLFLFCYQ